MKYKYVLVVFLAIILSAISVFGQSKTKITMTVEKDSIKIEELSKLIADIQKLEKKWKLDIKIEFEKKEKPNSIRFYDGAMMPWGNHITAPNLKVVDEKVINENAEGAK